MTFLLPKQQREHTNSEQSHQPGKNQPLDLIWTWVSHSPWTFLLHLFLTNFWNRTFEDNPHRYVETGCPSVAHPTVSTVNLNKQQQQPFYGPLSGTTRVSRYQKKHSPTHHPDHHPIFISLFHLPWSTASSLFKLHAWQSFCTTSFHALFGLPLGLEPSTSYSIHFCTQSVSS